MIGTITESLTDDNLLFFILRIVTYEKLSFALEIEIKLVVQNNQTMVRTSTTSL